ncbi:hypothetical protein KC352_g39813, partial [Hortaea werneckii]
MDAHSHGGVELVGFISEVAADGKITADLCAAKWLGRTVFVQPFCATFFDIRPSQILLVSALQSIRKFEASLLATDGKMDPEYKAAKEAHVSLLSGGGIWEINAVTCIAPAAAFL